MPTKIVTRLQKRWKRRSTFEEKCAFCQESGEWRTSATGVLGTSHVFSASSRADMAPCWKGFADAVNNVVRCWRRQKTEDGARVCGEFETILNSCSGKGIVDTGCAKIMMGSDTFQQYLGLLNPKERASIEKLREKNRFRFGDNETRLSFWTAVIPINSGRQVCRSHFSSAWELSWIWKQDK